jgi:hypothetical protein
MPGKGRHKSEELAMTICKKRCQYCHRWFKPDKRKVGIQETCMREQCQRKRQAETSRRWRADPENAVSYQDRRTEIIKWAKEEGYWKKRREEDEQYREKDNKRRQEAHRNEAVRRDAAKQISITEISVEDRVRSLGLEVVNAAKRISIESLFRRERLGGLPLGGHFLDWNAAKQISTPWGKGSPIMAA